MMLANTGRYYMFDTDSVDFTTEEITGYGTSRNCKYTLDIYCMKPFLRVQYMNAYVDIDNIPNYDSRQSPYDILRDAIAELSVPTLQSTGSLLSTRYTLGAYISFSMYGSNYVDFTAVPYEFIPEGFELRDWLDMHAVSDYVIPTINIAVLSSTPKLRYNYYGIFDITAGSAGVGIDADYISIDATSDSLIGYIVPEVEDVVNRVIASGSVDTRAHRIANQIMDISDNCLNVRVKMAYNFHHRSQPDTSKPVVSGHALTLSEIQSAVTSIIDEVCYSDIEEISLMPYLAIDISVSEDGGVITYFDEYDVQVSPIYIPGPFLISGSTLAKTIAAIELATDYDEGGVCQAHTLDGAIDLLSSSIHSRLARGYNIFDRSQYITMESSFEGNVTVLVTSDSSYEVSTGSCYMFRNNRSTSDIVILAPGVGTVDIYSQDDSSAALYTAEIRKTINYRANESTYYKCIISASQSADWPDNIHIVIRPQ